MQSVNNLFQVCRGIWLVCFLFVIVLLMSTNPLGGYVLLLFCFLAFVACGFNKSRLDTISLWLILFSFTYSTIALGNGVVASYTEWVGNIISPLIFYLFGKKISSRVNNDNTMLIVILLTVFFYAAIQYFTVIRDIAMVGLINIDRVLFNENQMGFQAATLVGVNVAYGFVGLITFFTINNPLKTPISFLFLGTSILSILSTIHLVNRSGLVVAAICIVFIVLYRMEGNVGKFVMWIIILGGVGFLIYKLGLISDEVIFTYENRFTGDEENTQSMGGRSFRWVEGLEKMFEYPFGWSTNIFTFNRYAHNFWVDVARVAGAIPFFCLVGITVTSISLLVKAFEIKKNPIIATLIGLYICFFFSSFVEPIMEGAPIHFFMSCFFIGITKVYVEQRKCKSGQIQNNQPIKIGE